MSVTDVTDVTGTAPPSSSPAAVEHDQRGDALACFDRDGTAVFASLCRSTAGNRQLAADILRQTFVRLSEAQLAGVLDRTDRQHLVLAAHRALLADRRSDDDYYDDTTALNVSGDEPAWVLRRWGLALATLSALTARERTALNLHLIDGISLGDIAELLQRPVAAVTALIDSGRQALQVTATTESTDDILRRGEMWLGDAERDDVRVALGAQTQRPAPHTDDGPARPKHRWRPSKRAGLAALVVGILAAVGVRWVQDLPDERAAAPEPIAESAPPVVAVQQVSDGTTVHVTPVPNALADAEVIVMAKSLTDPAVVVPDAIVKYFDGKVGLSWHAPCNRPAMAIAVTNTRSGAVVELTTGEFPVISCVGMPDRWTAVVETALPLVEGAIRPVDDAGALVTPFDGYIEASSQGGTAEPISADAGYSSALVDDGNQPWVYGVGCSSRSARYQSPIGAIFEIRTETADPASYSSSDAIVCNNLASRPVLAGPDGATFPEPDGDGSGRPNDCRGPIGSPTDVSSGLRSGFGDRDWSTWDGCRVRSDVIFTEDQFETCADVDVRTITFAATLGERISDGTDTQTFIRDPEQVVVGTRPPLLTYVIAPNDLTDTGLRYGDQELLLSPRGMAAIYVRVGDEVERWPRLTDDLTCA